MFRFFVKFPKSWQRWLRDYLYFGPPQLNASLNKHCAWYAVVSSNAKRQGVRLLLRRRYPVE